MEQEQFTVNFNLNEFLKAYAKEDFIRSVFVDFLKKNPKIVTDALASYVVMDLVKSGSLETISNNTKEAVNAVIAKSGQDYNCPVKKSVYEVMSNCVAEHKNIINKNVVDAINSEGSKDSIIRRINEYLQLKVKNALSNIAEDD